MKSLIIIFQKKIKIKRLDDLIKIKKINFNNKKVDFIKIDVEGYELDIIKGAKNFLKKHKPIILIELDIKILGKKKINKIFFILKKLRYNSFYSNNGIKFKSTSEKNLPYLQNDRFFKKDITKQRQLKKGERRYYINNFWFFPK